MQRGLRGLHMTYVLLTKFVLILYSLSVYFHPFPLLNIDLPISGILKTCFSISGLLNICFFPYQVHKELLFLYNAYSMFAFSISGLKLVNQTNLCDSNVIFIKHYLIIRNKYSVTFQRHGTTFKTCDL
jgi:hypothetical protein